VPRGQVLGDLTPEKLHRSPIKIQKIQNTIHLENLAHEKLILQKHSTLSIFLNDVNIPKRHSPTDVAGRPAFLQWLILFMETLKLVGEQNFNKCKYNFVIRQAE
jgi:hypothetical protein